MKKHKKYIVGAITTSIIIQPISINVFANEINILKSKTSKNISHTLGYKDIKENKEQNMDSITGENIIISKEGNSNNYYYGNSLVFNIGIKSKDEKILKKGSKINLNMSQHIYQYHSEDISPKNTKFKVEINDSGYSIIANEDIIINDKSIINLKFIGKIAYNLGNYDIKTQFVSSDGNIENLTYKYNISILKPSEPNEKVAFSAFWTGDNYKGTYEFDEGINGGLHVADRKELNFKATFNKNNLHVDSSMIDRLEILMDTDQTLDDSSIQIKNNNKDVSSNMAISLESNKLIITDVNLKDLNSFDILFSTIVNKFDKIYQNDFKIYYKDGTSKVFTLYSIYINGFLGGVPYIKGVKDISIPMNSKLDLLEGISVTDIEDGEIPANNIEFSIVKKEGDLNIPIPSLNTTIPGKYEITYSVKDKDNNVVSKTCILTITNDPPVINGADDISIKKGIEFNSMNGVISIDKEDGIITDKVIVKGSVDKNIPGKYELIYEVTDSGCSTTSIKRLVTVENKSTGENSDESDNGSVTPIPPNSSDNLIEIEEIVGKDRFETAGDISKKWNQADNVIISNAYSIVDNLTSTPFAYVKNAPILLSNKNKLHEITKKELTRLKTKTVYLVGGTDVLNKNIEKEISDMGIIVIRIGGDDRFETSLKLAVELDKLNDISKLALVNGQDGLADAVSISPIAAENNIPIILSSNKGDIPQGKYFIKSEDIQQSYIIGGTSVVPNKVEQDLSNLIINKHIERLSGPNRNETNSKVINKFYASEILNNLFVAKNGMNKENELVDSLTVGVLAAKEKSPVALVGDALTESQKEIISKKKFKKITRIGGNGNENAFNEIKKIKGIE